MRRVLPSSSKSIATVALILDQSGNYFSVAGNSCVRPRPSVVARTAATSSASAELNVTDFCVLHQDLTQCAPLLATPPVVDLAVRLHPAQSLSEYTVNTSTGLWNGNCQITRGFPMRYLAKRRSFFSSPRVGAAIPRHTSFAAYCMSAQS